MRPRTPGGGRAPLGGREVAGGKRGAAPKSLDPLPGRERGLRAPRGSSCPGAAQRDAVLIHAFVTNLRILPLAVYRFYIDRAAVKVLIKELKTDCPLAEIPTGQFDANEAYLHLLLFAYDLVNWFRRFCLPAEYQAMPLGTLRRRLLLIPGEFVHASQGPTLRIPSLPGEGAIKLQ